MQGIVQQFLPRRGWSWDKEEAGKMTVVDATITSILIFHPQRITNSHIRCYRERCSIETSCSPVDLEELVRMIDAACGADLRAYVRAIAQFIRLPSQRQLTDYTAKFQEA